MRTLYGVYASRASRPLWLLEELGLAFTHVPVIQAYRLQQANAATAPFNTASADFVAINPQGQIPVWVEEELILTESLAITLHIARKYGGDLGPKTDAELALITQWALFAATSIETPALEILFAQEAATDAHPENEALIAVCAEKLRRPLARLEMHLGQHPWLVGDRFSVADINTAECLRYAQGHAALIAEFPAVAAWLAKAQARPGFQAMWAKRAKELA